MDNGIIKYLSNILLALVTISLLLSCRDDIPIQLSEETATNPGNSANGNYSGFYLLNEGNMGSNKASLDYYDFITGIYSRNIYAERNPSVPKELGDVGNDLQIYGSRLYAVINASNKVEVMDIRTTKRIGHVDIPNCRYITFHDGYAYVTSYAGPIEISPEYKQKGYVAKIDTNTLQVINRCVVGYQPDGITIYGNYIYVVNSGGYRGASHTSRYERTISAINIDTFSETNQIDVAYNLNLIIPDSRGNLWVSTREAGINSPSRLFYIDHLKEVADSINIHVNDMWLDGDSLFLIGPGHFSIVNTASRKVITNNFITDGTETQLETPYGIMVHPETKDVFITDAGDYVNPGRLYRFDKEGNKKWSVQTGDIPSQMALIPKHLCN